MASYRGSRDRIDSGDLLLFRNDASVIADESRTPYSHAGIAVWHNRVLLCAESRELRGGRIVTLSSQVERFPKRIDVFRPTCNPNISSMAAEWAVRQAGHEYNYAGLIGCTLLHLPILRRILRYFPDTSDTTLSAWAVPKFCSQLACWSYRSAAQAFQVDWDPVPNLGDRYCEPGHLALSGSFRRIFTQLVHGVAA